MDRFTNSTLRTLSLLFATAAALLGTPGSCWAARSRDLPPNTGRDAVRQVVQNQCVPDWLQHHNPSPCEKVVLSDPSAGSSGYALLADPDGGAHYLLIPIQTMASTDASELLDPNLPNYFEEAWRSREVLSTFVGHPVPGTAVGLAVGTAGTRKQNQFYIHIECLRPQVVDSLKAAADRLSERWGSLTVAGYPFQAMRLSAQGLEVSNPFELVAASSPDARHHLGSYTMVVAGMQFSNGPGFVLLAGTGLSGDLLMDSGCTVAGGGG